MEIENKAEAKTDNDPIKCTKKSNANVWKNLAKKGTSSTKKTIKLNVLNHDKPKTKKDNKKKKKNNKKIENNTAISVEDLNKLDDFIENINNNVNKKIDDETKMDKNNDDNKDDIKDDINNNDNIFDGLSSKLLNVGKKSYRAIRVPGHRMIHMRRLWKSIVHPIVTHLKLQIRMNSKKNVIELRTSNLSTIDNALQKGSDFIRASILGFDIKDSIALIRLDNIFLECFDIRDVKMFKKKSDHWMRAIGRIAGQYGKIKYSIENSTNTRIIIFGFNVHILGSYQSIKLARNAISRLIIGSAPGNVYAKLTNITHKMKHNF